MIHNVTCAVASMNVLKHLEPWEKETCDSVKEQTEPQDLEET